METTPIGTIPMEITPMGTMPIEIIPVGAIPIDNHFRPELPQLFSFS
jgi:hypothetical protein